MNNQGKRKTGGIGDYVPGSTPASLTPVILKDYVVPNTVIHFLKVKKLHNWTVTVYCMLFINKSKYLVDDDLNIFLSINYCMDFILCIVLRLC